MADISAIKLPNGNTYDLVDRKSGFVTTDTKNTTGSKQPAGTRQKLYLIGASSQSAYAETYSYSDTYVDNDGTLHAFGALAIQQVSDSYHGVFMPSDLTANRVYSLPNKAGTIALTSDIPSVPSNIVNTITTSAGTHSTISSQKGNVNFNVPTNTSHLTNDSGFITGMTILSYGSSTWQNFIDAYDANKVVYCRASSNSNPASGSQTRLAFMAYVNNATTPTEVEFQYYRSVSSHTASQQGDQVFIYKLNKTNGWSVTIREASVKVVAGTGLGGTYSNGTMTLTGPTKVSDLTNDSGFVTTDEKVRVTVLNSNDTYYPILASGVGTDIRQIATAGIGFKDSGGGSTLSLGLDSNHWGVLKIGGESEYSVTVLNPDITANRTLTLPDKTGTIALQGDSIEASQLPVSGVTAGTYDGGSDTKNGFYIPSFTVDSTGRITSATDLGTLIPFVTPLYSSIGVLSGTQYGPLFKCHSAASYDGNIPAGHTSATVSTGSSSGYVTQILGVLAWESSTFKPVIVDWVSSSNNVADSITITVSIAEANTNAIYFRLLKTQSSSM